MRAAKFIMVKRSYDAVNLGIKIAARSENFGQLFFMVLYLGLKIIEVKFRRRFLLLL